MNRSGPIKASYPVYFSLSWTCSYNNVTFMNLSKEFNYLAVTVTYGYEWGEGSVVLQNSLADINTDNEC